jgi:hypothetical protein
MSYKISIVAVSTEGQITEEGTTDLNALAVLGCGLSSTAFHYEKMRQLAEHLRECPEDRILGALMGMSPDELTGTENEFIECEVLNDEDEAIWQIVIDADNWQEIQREAITLNLDGMDDLFASSIQKGFIVGFRKVYAPEAEVYLHDLTDGVPCASHDQAMRIAKLKLLDEIDKEDSDRVLESELTVTDCSNGEVIFYASFDDVEDMQVCLEYDFDDIL